MLQSIVTPRMRIALAGLWVAGIGFAAFTAPLAWLLDCGVLAGGVTGGATAAALAGPFLSLDGVYVGAGRPKRRGG